MKRKLDLADVCLLLGAGFVTVALVITKPVAALYFWGVALIALGLYRGL